MEYILLAAGFIGAYLLGSVPTSVWVGRWFYHIDIREQGSGNAGATNTFRVLGPKAAIPVMIVDVTKGFLAVWMMQYFVPTAFSENQLIYVQILAGLSAVAGHTWPLFAGFRGGKGVATLFGLAIYLYPVAVWVAVIVFVVILLSTGYVSLGSVVAGIVFSISANVFFPSHHTGLVVLSIVAALFVIYTHRHNIVRLTKGTENRFYFRKKK